MNFVRAAIGFAAAAIVVAVPAVAGAVVVAVVPAIVAGATVVVFSPAAVAGEVGCFVLLPYCYGFHYAQL